MLFRVSEVEMFRQYLEDEEFELETLVSRMRGEVPATEAMEAGTAFHRALERASIGETNRLEANGYQFLIECDGELELPEIRELRASKPFGGITVTGCVDALTGLRIDDHKTTGRFDPDRYLSGYQWRLYLSIFGAKTFRWNVFELRDLGAQTYIVFAHHRLEQHRYPGMEQDCERMCARLEQFAQLHLLERIRNEAVA